jgi:predicted transcriptional regulator
MKYRSRIEIISQILETANGGVTGKLKIMYKVNISYAQLNEYLQVLTQNSLLSYHFDTRTFKTTEKGLRFVHIYNQMGGMIKASPPEQQQI